MIILKGSFMEKHVTKRIGLIIFRENVGQKELLLEKNVEGFTILQGEKKKESDIMAALRILLERTAILKEEITFVKGFKEELVESDRSIVLVLGEFKSFRNLEIGKSLEWVNIFSKPKEIIGPLMTNLHSKLQKHFRGKEDPDWADNLQKIPFDSRPYVVHCKKSKYDVYIGRPNPSIPTKDFRWGNPFKISDGKSREEVIRLYEEWILSQPQLIQQAKKVLKGKVLACWCAPLPCHGDILSRIANDDEFAQQTVSYSSHETKNLDLLGNTKMR